VAGGAAVANRRFDTIRPIRWREGRLELLDQRLLPGECRYLSYDHSADVADAIRDMVVRGAPAIGVTAAWGVVLAARESLAEGGEAGWRTPFGAMLARLRQSRPTAVNLIWAIERMERLAAGIDGDPLPQLELEAEAIQLEDLAANYRMGELGGAWIAPGSSILTHCNAGALATAGYGTALSVVRDAAARGHLAQVYADETRPWLQGARLTAWELLAEGIPTTLIADGAAAWLMRQRRIDWVVVGSDRIAANGDVANKIGTYSLAINARRHGVRVMVVAPTSTIDLSAESGESIPIEERSPEEVLAVMGQPVAAAGAAAWNPVFDVTPADLVDLIVTERGVVESPDRAKIARLMEG
jgi:methylthioribose-1-phosphate isomerase